MQEQILNPILTLIEVMRKNIRNKSFLRSLKAIVRKIKGLIKNRVLDKTIFTNLKKLRNKKLPNSYEKVIDNIILPIMNIFNFINPEKAIRTNVFLSKPYNIQLSSAMARMTPA